MPDVREQGGRPVHLRQAAPDWNLSYRSELCYRFSYRYEEEAGMSKKQYRP